MTPCKLVGRYRLFGRAGHLYLRKYLLPWKWRRYVPLACSFVRTNQWRW